MAYDEVLAARIRDLVAGEPSLTEQRMFGGLAFLIGGNMAVVASGQGGILVRVDPEQTETLVATTSARVMEMRGRQMRGCCASTPTSWAMRPSSRPGSSVGRRMPGRCLRSGSALERPLA
jgi:hypothetical protein